MSNDSSNGRPVTVRDLERELRAFRWEVRFLIVVALIVGQVFPLGSAANAIASLF